jgi:hypothetical protein
MKSLFADAMYWIAIANPKDHWPSKTVQVMQWLGQVRLVTTESLLKTLASDEWRGSSCQ